VTGLVAASKKTVEGITTHVLPAKSEHALNKFLIEYESDEQQLNTERLNLLQESNETRWSSDGVVIIDDTFIHKTGEQIPNAGKFYDHTVPGYIFGQNLIYALYAEEKTTYPLGFRLYEKDDKTRIELATELVDELIEIGVPADTYLFDMGYCSEEFVTHLEKYGKEWVSAVKTTHASRTVENAWYREFRECVLKFAIYNSEHTCSTLWSSRRHSIQQSRTEFSCKVGKVSRVVWVSVLRQPQFVTAFVAVVTGTLFQPSP
jgi:SRSO17 transposase